MSFNGDFNTTFAGLTIYDYDPTKPLQDPTTHAPRLQVEFETEDRAADFLKTLMADPRAEELTALVFGSWAGELTDEPPQEEIETLVAGKDKLPSLRAIFLADIPYSENEMSWIMLCGLGPIWSAFPKLEQFIVRGCEDLSLELETHDHLKSLRIETGGMDQKTVQEVGAANLPALESLELFIGTDRYGRSCSVEDIVGILHAEKFPKLTKLGLQNADIINELIPGLVASSLFKQLKEVDLAYGVLGDEGANQLLAADLGHLEKINLHHNYLTEETLQKFAELDCEVDGSGQQDATDEDRYVAVGE